jgi:hypothetical protein
MPSTARQILHSDELATKELFRMSALTVSSDGEVDDVDRVAEARILDQRAVCLQSPGLPASVYLHSASYRQRPRKLDQEIDALVLANRPNEESTSETIRGRVAKVDVCAILDTHHSVRADQAELFEVRRADRGDPRIELAKAVTVGTGP